MREKLQRILDTYDELTAKLGDPVTLADQKEYTRLAKQQRAQAQLAEKAREYLSAAEQLDEAKALLKNESDQDMKEFSLEFVAAVS